MADQQEATGIGGAPRALVVSSTRVESVGSHERVAVWNRGGLAGTLVVEAGDGERIAARLERQEGDDSARALEAAGVGQGESAPIVVEQRAGGKSVEQFRQCVAAALRGERVQLVTAEGSVLIVPAVTVTHVDGGDDRDRLARESERTASLIVGALVARMGGGVTITQADLETATALTLHRTDEPLKGGLTFATTRDGVPFRSTPSTPPPPPSSVLDTVPRGDEHDELDVPRIVVVDDDDHRSITDWSRATVPEAEPFATRDGLRALERRVDVQADQIRSLQVAAPRGLDAPITLDAPSTKRLDALEQRMVALETLAQGHFG